MRRLLDAVYLMALVILLPWLIWRAWRTGRYRQRLREKLAGFTGEVPEGAVWFHAVSVGEVLVLRQLVPAFRDRHPGRACVVSSTTDTGLEEARKIFSDLVVFAFPFDFSWAVEKTLRRLRPALVVLCESELWPNFLLAAKRLHVPVAVVNGRMSLRSQRRHGWVAPLVRWMLRSLDVVGVQTKDHAGAMLELGAIPGRVQVTGNIKYDGALLDRHHPRTEELRRLFGVAEGDLVWVAGSTQAPEEEIVLAIWDTARARHRRLWLFLVPRHPDRFEEVARLLERKGVAFVRRSSLSLAEARGMEPGIVLVDTMGELGALWGLADLGFVGGSLDGKRGGQNMIEPAALGVAVTFGSHVWNFKETARRLSEIGGAYQVSDAQELETVTLRLLDDVEERRAAGKEARAFVLAQQGATMRTLALLDGVLAARPAGERAA